MTRFCHPARCAIEWLRRRTYFRWLGWFRRNFCLDTVVRLSAVVSLRRIINLPGRVGPSGDISLLTHRMAGQPQRRGEHLPLHGFRVARRALLSEKIEQGFPNVGGSFVIHDPRIVLSVGDQVLRPSAASVCDAATRRTTASTIAK